MTAKLVWTGVVNDCDICGHPLSTVFYDAKTRGGPWGLLCPTCFTIRGVGIGQGVGQKYELQREGIGAAARWHWIKVEG